MNINGETLIKSSPSGSMTAWREWLIEARLDYFRSVIKYLVFPHVARLWKSFSTSWTIVGLFSRVGDNVGVERLLHFKLFPTQDAQESDGILGVFCLNVVEHATLAQICFATAGERAWVCCCPVVVWMVCVWSCNVLARENCLWQMAHSCLGRSVCTIRKCSLRQAEFLRVFWQTCEGT